MEIWSRRDFASFVVERIDYDFEQFIHTRRTALRQLVISGLEEGEAFSPTQIAEIDNLTDEIQVLRATTN